MRILFWSSSALPAIGGLEIMLHQLTTRLHAEGHEVIVVSNNPHNTEFKKCVVESVQTVLLPFARALHDRNLFLIKKIMQSLQEIVTEFKPDVIHFHGFLEILSFFQVRLLNQNAIPSCLTVHGLLEQTHYRTPFCLQLWSLVKAVSVVSLDLQRGLEEQGMTHVLLRVIYNGLSKVDSPCRPLSINPPVLLMIGRLTEEKCFDVAFHALKILVKKHSDIRLILVGGGHLFSELTQLKQRLALSAHIQMTDFVHPEKITCYIDQASLVLVPSSYESFSLVALQAAMRARPVVASAVHGLKEVVVDQETGRLIAPNHPVALAQTVDALLSDVHCLETMGKSAQQRAHQLFGIENCAQQYVKLFELIMEK